MDPSARPCFRPSVNSGLFSTMGRVSVLLFFFWPVFACFIEGGNYSNNPSQTYRQAMSCTRPCSHCDFFGFLKETTQTTRNGLIDWCIRADGLALTVICPLFRRRKLLRPSVMGINSVKEISRNISIPKPLKRWSQVS